MVTLPTAKMVNSPFATVATASSEEVQVTLFVITPPAISFKLAVNLTSPFVSTETEVWSRTNSLTALLKIGIIPASINQRFVSRPLKVALAKSASLIWVTVPIYLPSPSWLTLQSASAIPFAYTAYTLLTVTSPSSQDARAAPL